MLHCFHGDDKGERGRKNGITPQVQSQEQLG